MASLSPSLPPSFSDGEWANTNAKKHLWTSDLPAVTSYNSLRRADSLPQASDSMRHPPFLSADEHERAKAREEALERTLQASSRRTRRTLPPLPHVRHNHHYDEFLPRPFNSPSSHTGHEQRGHQTFLGGHDGRTHGESPRRHSQSISVFNSPKGPHMWPGQQELSQVKDHQEFYVNYGLSTPSSSNSVSSRSSSPGQYSERSLHLERSPDSLVPQKRRSCSPPRSTCSESKKILEPLERIQIDERRTHDHLSLGPSSSHSHPYDTHHGAPFLNSRSTLPISSLQDGVMQARKPRLPRKDNGQIPNDEYDSELDREEWEQYAKPTVSADGTSRRWICQWESFQSGVLRTCNYKSKKQLVKRHIETTHLHYKPFQCSVCNKAFPQKTSLDTHMHGHTGSTPHECRYGCGMAFKDPARRHRHMVEEHGYIPRQSKKKYKSS